jgi:hypothetical protein
MVPVLRVVDWIQRIYMTVDGIQRICMTVDGSQRIYDGGWDPSEDSGNSKSKQAKARMLNDECQALYVTRNTLSALSALGAVNSPE